MKLTDLLPKEKIINMIQSAREIPSPSEKDYQGLINPDSYNDSALQIVIQGPNQKWGINFDVINGVNTVIFDENKFKNSADTNKRVEAHQSLKSLLEKNFSPSDYTALGSAVYMKAIRYMKHNYPDHYSFFSTCRKEQFTEGAAAIGWDKRAKQHIIYYNPTFFGRGTLEEILFEIIELPEHANFDNLDFTYIYDWMAALGCFYLLHEILHAIFDEVKKYHVERRDLEYVDPKAKNKINDYYINSKLEDLVTNDVFINKIYVDVLGTSERRFAVKTLISDNFMFEGVPSANVARNPDDPYSDLKTYLDIVNNITPIVNKEMLQGARDSYDFLPSAMEHEEHNLSTQDRFFVSFSAKFSRYGINDAAEFYKVCREVIEWVFGKPPKIKDEEVTISIDDDNWDSPDDSPDDVEDEDTIFFPVIPGTAVRINDTGEEGIVSEVKRNEDGSFSITVVKGNHKGQTKVTESQIVLLENDEVKYDGKIAKGWEIEEPRTPLGEFSPDDFEIIGQPPHRGGGKPQPSPSDQDDGESEDKDSQSSDQGDDSETSEPGASSEPSPTSDDSETSEPGASSEPSPTSDDSETSEPGASSEPSPTSDEEEGEASGQGEDSEGEDGEDVAGKSSGDDDGEEGSKEEEDSGIDYGGEDTEREAKNKLSDLAKKTKNVLDLPDGALDDVIDPGAKLKQRAEEQALSQWKRLLRKKIEEATGVEGIFDPDRQSRRLPGVIGEEIYETTLEDICFSFDVSISMDIVKNYGVILDFLETMFSMSGIKFQRIGMNYWSIDWRATQLMKMSGRRTTDLAKTYLSSIASDIKDGYGTNENYVFAPFVDGHWKSAKPSLCIVFTDGGFNGGGLRQEYKKFVTGRWRNSIIVIVVPGQGGRTELTHAKNILPLKEKQFLHVKSKS